MFLSMSLDYSSHSDTVLIGQLLLFSFKLESYLQFTCIFVISNQPKLYFYYPSWLLAIWMETFRYLLCESHQSEVVRHTSKNPTPDPHLDLVGKRSTTLV